MTNKFLGVYQRRMFIVSIPRRLSFEDLRFLFSTIGLDARPIEFGTSIPVASELMEEEIEELTDDDIDEN